MHESYGTNENYKDLCLHNIEMLAVVHIHTRQDLVPC